MNPTLRLHSPFSRYICTAQMPRLSVVDRARVVGRVEAGQNVHDVCNEFGVHRTTVWRLMARWRATGSVVDGRRSGRPKVTVPRMDRYVRLSVLRNRRLNATDIQNKLHRVYGVRLSDQTIRNRLHAAGLRARIPVKRPAMSALNRVRRLRWCRQHRRWNFHDWGNVLFSDESRFCLKKVDGRVHVWRRRGERYSSTCIQDVTPYGGGSVMVWGGISSNGRTALVPIDGNLNARGYIDDVLEPHAIPQVYGMGPNAVLQDDNARPHRARIVDQHLQIRHVNRMDWPACSPDLNPIEHLWDQLGRAVRKRVDDRTTLEGLRDLLIQEWNAIPQRNIVNLIRSMRRRCEAVINAFGYGTRY